MGGIRGGMSKSKWRGLEPVDSGIYCVTLTEAVFKTGQRKLQMPGERAGGRAGGRPGRCAGGQVACNGLPVCTIASTPAVLCAVRYAVAAFGQGKGMPSPDVTITTPNNR
jgi:hypothetical protein